MANLDKQRLVPQATAYARSRQIQLDYNALLGDGTDGAVWSTSRGSALKVFYRQHNYVDELECFRRLTAAGKEQLGKLYIPKFVDADDRFLAIEMGVVTPPRLLDFGKVYLDSPPPYWGDGEIRAKFDAEGAWLFRDRWPDVIVALEELRQLGIYYVDPKPGNILFGDEADDLDWAIEPPIDYSEFYE